MGIMWDSHPFAVLARGGCSQNGIPEVDGIKSADAILPPPPGALE